MRIIYLLAQICFFSFLSCSSWADLDGPDYNNRVEKTKNDEFDLFPITNGGTVSFLRENLNIYDNLELRGEPFYVLSSKEIKFSNVVHNFKDISKKPMIIPIDFLKMYASYLSLAIKEYKNGIGIIENKGKPYYFKLNKNSFGSVYSTDWHSEIRWRVLREKKDVDKILNELRKTPEFKTIIDNMKKCVLLKSIDCLAELTTSSSYFVENVKQNLLELGSLEDKNICVPSGKTFKLKNYEDLDSKAKPASVDWTKFEKLITLSESDLKYEVQTYDFDKVSGLTIKTKDEPVCMTKKFIKVDIQKLNYIGNWYLVGLIFQEYSFH